MREISTPIVKEWDILHIVWGGSVDHGAGKTTRGSPIQQNEIIREKKKKKKQTNALRAEMGTANGIITQAFTTNDDSRRDD
jgi:hypothetical protein